MGAEDLKDVHTRNFLADLKKKARELRDMADGILADINAFYDEEAKLLQNPTKPDD